MTARATKPAAVQEPDLLHLGMELQEEGLRLLFAEIRALQAMIPVGGYDTPSDAEAEASFDNMPV